MTNQEAIEFLSQIMDSLLASNSWLPSTHNPIKESFGMAINALEGKDTNVPSRKGVFIPDITVEMFRNASLEGVEDLMASGEMEDISLPSAQPKQSIAQERYEDLCEYFKDCSDQGRSVLNDRKEFKSWLDRMKWHVMECNKLGRELEKLSSAQPDIIRCRNCKFASGDSRICMKFGHSPIGELDFCAWAERREDG